jgi:hypothetical protein
MTRKRLFPLLTILLILSSTAIPGIANAKEGDGELGALIDLSEPILPLHPNYLSGAPALAFTGQDPSGRLFWSKDKEELSPGGSLQAAGGAAALVPYRSPAVKFSRNILLTQDRGRLPYQTEPHIAVNPKDPDHIVMGTIDYNFPGVVNYVSIDGGATWDGPYQPQTPRAEYTGVGDPVVAFDREGNVYISQLSIRIADFMVGGFVGSAYVMSVASSTSSDGGFTWEETLLASPGEVFTFDYPTVEGEPPGGEVWLYYVDKSWLAAGPSPDNPEQDILYISYTLFVTKYRLTFIETLPFLEVFEELSVIEVVHSEDGGHNWSLPVEVSPVTQIMGTPNRLVQGSQPAVAPDGTLYVAYFDSTVDGFLEETGEIWVAASDDMGETFYQSERAATFLELNYLPRTASFRLWGSGFPQLAIGPNGEIYAGYVSYPEDKPMDGGDVFMVSSLNGGQTWTLPITVNDDTTQGFQFYSSIAVDPEGSLHMMWADTRDDPTGLAYHIYYSSSEDQGKTWEFNSRVSDFATNPNFAFPNGAFIGDYFSIKATSEDVYMVWADGRMGEVQGMSQKIAFARKRLMPTPSVFLSPPSGPAGRDVTIQGSHFQPESEIFIIVGGVLTSTGRTSQDGTFTMTIFAPISGEGTRDIVVSDISGNVALAAFYTEFGFDTFQDAVEAIENRFDPLQQNIEDIENSLVGITGNPSNPVNSGSGESSLWLLSILAGIIGVSLAVLAALRLRQRS